MERPLPVLAFTLQRRLGMGYELHRPRWGLQGTVFSRDINEHYGSEGYALRNYYRGGSEESRIFHIGISSLILAGDDDAQFRARPESHRNTLINVILAKAVAGVPGIHNLLISLDSSVRRNDNYGNDLNCPM